MDFDDGVSAPTSRACAAASRPAKRRLQAGPRLLRAPGACATASGALRARGYRLARGRRGEGRRGHCTELTAGMPHRGGV
jgi:hypothetical protein